MLTLPNLPLPVSYETYAQLCRELPQYPEDTEESRAHRAAVAMAGVADLHPADAFQALLAARVIAADAHVTDSFVAAKQHRNEFSRHCQSIAQAACMMRQMRGFYGTLLDRQRQRQQPGASAGARILQAYLQDCPAPDEVPPRAARPAEPAGVRPEAQPVAGPTEPPCAVPAAHLAAAADPVPPAAVPAAALAEPPASLPRTALPATPAAESAAPAAETSTAAAAMRPAAAAQPAAPPPPAEPPATLATEAPAPQPAPAAAGEPAPLRIVAVTPAAPPADAPPQSEAIRQAEAYAERMGLLAAMIRADGGVSQRVLAQSSGLHLPGDPAVIHALVHANTEVLRVLDQVAVLLDETGPDEMVRRLAA